MIFITTFFIYSFSPKNQKLKVLGVSTTSNYTVDESIFTNPERGFHSNCDIYSGYNLSSNAATLGNTLIHVNFRLDSFRTSPLSSAMLDTIANAFNTARANNVKLIIRFMYNAGPYPNCEPDASEAQIITHIQQLKPVLAAGSDVIAAFDAGFIGCWGEWHTSTNNLTTDEIRTRIFKSELANFPANRQIQLRTPDYIKAIWPSLTEAERARVGHHNDCFLANDTDSGTYADPVTDKAYLANNIGLNAIIGGETCKVSSRSTCPTALSEMQQIHYSEINEAYHEAVLQSWKDGGCFNTMKKNLGYRLSLINANYPTSIQPGETFTFKSTIKNSGFASIYNSRKVYLVLYNTSNSYTLPLQVNPKNWKSDTTNYIDEVVTVSTNAIIGNYNLALWLPDASDSLKSKPAYSIRFANLNTWVQNLGYNLLATNIAINNTTTSPNPTVIPTIKPTITSTTSGQCTVCSNGNNRSPGDANCDGKINELDFATWLSEYQKGITVKADFDCDGKTSINDFSLWNTYF